MKVFRSIVYVSFLISCNAKTNEVKTVALINTVGRQSDIFIFFEQDTLIGNVSVKDCKHFFDVRNQIEIFCINEDIGEGFIEYYSRNGNKLKQYFYHYPQGPKNWKPTDFTIAGGALRQIYDVSKKRPIKYITFKADYVDNLKDNLDIPDEKVMKVYKAIYKNDSLTSEDLE